MGKSSSDRPVPESDRLTSTQPYSFIVKHHQYPMYAKKIPIHYYVEYFLAFGQKWTQIIWFYQSFINPESPCVLPFSCFALIVKFVWGKHLYAFWNESQLTSSQLYAHIAIHMCRVVLWWCWAIPWENVLSDIQNVVTSFSLVTVQKNFVTFFRMNLCFVVINTKEYGKVISSNSQLGWFSPFLWNRWRNYMSYRTQRNPPSHAPFLCLFYYQWHFHQDDQWI